MFFLFFVFFFFFGGGRGVGFCASSVCVFLVDGVLCFFGIFDTAIFGVFLQP